MATLKKEGLSHTTAPLESLSKDKAVQAIVDDINDLIFSYKKEYHALQTKHEVVTELNQIGTWDAEFIDGELNRENHNDYNPIFRQTLGFSDETDFPNVLDSWYNTVSEIDMDMVNQAYEAHLFHSHPYDIEYRSKKKDNSIEWVHVRAKALTDEDGKVYRHIGTLSNIHQQKLDQLKVEQLLARLDLIEKSLSYSVGTVEGAWGIDFEKEETEEKYWFSPQFKRLLGFDEAAKNLDNNSWLQLIHPDEQKAIREEFNHLLAGDSNQTDFANSFRMMTVVGEEKWFSMIATVIFNEDGKPTLVSGVLRDIHHDVLRSEEDKAIETNMNEFATALDELATNIDDITTEASDLAQENERTVTAAQQAKDHIDSTKVVTDLIKNISDQTNLLGINASIEASLAGVHGKGFDVVAKEIVSLSNETSTAVESIELILNTVNESVLQIVDSINTMTDKINNQASVSEEINSTTDIINERANQLLTFIQHLN